MRDNCIYLPPPPPNFEITAGMPQSCLGRLGRLEQLAVASVLKIGFTSRDVGADDAAFDGGGL